MATNSLEQQALDRVARMYAGFDRRQPQSRPQPPEPMEKEPAQEPPAEPPAAHTDAPVRQPGLLDTLMDDKEQSLILLLLLILMKDGADMNAVLALMYLLI